MAKSELLKRLGIAHPVIQAPMGGGPSTPELVAAGSTTPDGKLLPFVRIGTYTRTESPATRYTDPTGPFFSFSIALSPPAA